MQSPECAAGDSLRAHGLRVQLMLICGPHVSETAS